MKNKQQSWGQKIYQMNKHQKSHVYCFPWNYFTPAEQLVGAIWGLICPSTLADAALDMNLTTDTLIIEQHALSSEQRTPGNTAVISDRLLTASSQNHTAVNTADFRRDQ